jgi:uncharacterized protein with FMN-binding domain
VFKEKIFLLLGLGVVLFLSGCGTGKEVEKTMAMKIANVDLNKVADGTYLGSHPVGIMKYNVAVTVADHKIESIDIVRAFSGTEYSRKGQAILDTVVASQSLKVDVISGATVTSKAYLAAIRDALEKGLAD